MSKQVDERVVSMKFDNQDFEKDVKKTINTLDELDEKLQFKNATDGLENLEEAAKDLDFDGMADAVNGISNAFSSLGVIGRRVLENIADDVYKTTVAFTKSLSIDNVTAGWDKYAEKTTAVQTIMAATGKSIDEVNDSLSKLVWFTDETSYNFTDMAKNIGKFTSAGVDLDTAATAMEGIATWASISGQSVNEASRAMYNLAQAIGVGGVKLIDWKSIENANMATKEFKETVLETGVELGKLKKEADGTYTAIATGTEGISFSNFTDGLKDMWFDSELLLKTLDKYGGYADSLNNLYNELWNEGQEVTTSSIITDLRRIAKNQEPILDYSERTLRMAKELSLEVGTIGDRAFAAAQEAKTWGEVITSVKEAVASGWAQSFELVFGNYEQAKVLWTRMANDFWDIFASGAERRNSFLEEALNISGYDKLGEYLSGFGIEFDKFEDKLLGLYGNTIVEKVREVNGETEILQFTISELVSQYGSLSGVIKDSGVDMTKFVRNTMNEYKTAVEVSTEQTSYFKSIIQDLNNGVFGEASEQEARLTAAGYDYNTIMSMNNDLIEKGIIDWSKYTKEQIKSCGYTKDITTQHKTLGQALRSSDAELKKVLDTMTLQNGRDLLWDSLLSTLEYLTEVAGKLREAFNEVFDVITPQKVYDIIRSFSDWLNGLRLTESQLESLKSAAKAFATILNTIHNILSPILGLFVQALGIFKPIGKLILDLVGSVSEFIVGFEGATDAAELFNAIIESLSTAIDWLITKFDNLVERIRQNGYITSALTAIAGAIGLIGKAVTKIKEVDFKKIFSGFSGIDLKEVKVFESISTKFSEFTAKLKDAKTLEQIGESFNNLGSALHTSITNFFKPFQEDFSTFSDNFTATLTDLWERLKTLFKGASSITFDTNKGLFSVNGIFGAVFSLLSVKFVTSLSRVTDNLSNVFKQTGKLISTYRKHLAIDDYKTMVDGVVELCAGVLIISGSLYLISTIPSEKLWSSVGALMAVMAAVAALVLIVFLIVKQLTKLNDAKAKLAEVTDKVGGVFEQIRMTLKGFSRAAQMGAAAILIVSLVAAFGVIYLAFLSFLAIYKRSDADTIRNAMDAFIGLLAVTSVCAGAVTFASKNVSLGSFLSIIAFAIAMKAAMSVMKDIIKTGLDLFDWTDLMIQFVQLIGVITLASIAMSVSAPNWSKGIGAAAIMLSLVIALKGVMSVMKDLNGMENYVSSLGKLVGVLFVVIVAMAAIAKWIKPENWKGILSTVLALTTVVSAIKSMVSVLKDLSEMDWDTYWAGLFKFIGMLIPITIAAIALNGKATSGIGNLAAIILAITIALKLLQGMDYADMTASAIALGLLLIEVGAAFKIAGALSGDAKLQTMVGLGIVILALAGSLWLLKDIPHDDLLVAAVALSGVLLATAGMLHLVGTMQYNIIDIIALGTAIGLTTAALYILASLDNADQLLDIAISMSAVLIAIAGVMYILQGIPISGALTAIADLGIFLTGLSFIIFTLGAIFDETGTAAMNAGMKLLTLLGETLGSFVSGFINAMLRIDLTQLTESLEKFTPQLKEFVEVLSSEKFSNTEEKKVQTLVELFKSLRELGSIKMNETFFKNVEKVMSLLGESIPDFAEKTKDVDDAAISKIQKLGAPISKLLTAIADIPSDKGWLKGKQDDIKTTLTKLGEGIETFNNSLSNITESDIARITNIKEPILGIFEMLGKAPNSGGLLGLIMGENSGDQIGKELAGFGSGMAEFAASIRSITESDLALMQSMIDPVTALFNMLSNAPRTGGILDYIFGGKEVTEKLTPTGDVVAGVATQLQELATGVKNFVTTLKEVKPEEVDFAASIVQTIIDKLDALNNIEVEDIGKNIMEGIFKGMEKFLKDSATKTRVTTMSDDIINGFKDAFSMRLSFINSKPYTLGVNILDALYQGITHFLDSTSAERTIKSVSTIMNGFTKEFGIFTTFVNSKPFIVGFDVMTAMFDGVDNFINKQLRLRLFPVTTGIIEAFKDDFGFKQAESKPYSLGKTIMENFSNGVKDYGYLVTNKVSEICNNAVSTANSILGIHSPSTVFYQIGKYMDEGLANGISQNSSIVDKANAYIQDAIEQAKRIAEKETTMTITPVLDLSQVGKGASQLNAMLSSNKAYGLTGNFGTSQNGSTNTASSGNITFNQYNTSPKALSEIDIYRKTNSQLSRLKTGKLFGI